MTAADPMPIVERAKQHRYGLSMEESTKLFTQRLILRAPRSSDQLFIASLQRDPNVRKFLGGPQSEPDASTAAQAVVSDAEGNWIVDKADDAKPCAMVSLSPHKDGTDIELSYQFHPSVWGNGFATEALTALLRHGLEDLGLPRIIAETQTANMPSIRLLHRLGMEQIDTLHRFGQPQSIFSTR